VDRFTAKAISLGFRVVAHADSPVAGGEGTVEILAHLIFAGRSEQLPQPGERRPVTARPARKRASSSAAANLSASQKLKWFAVVAPGAEEIAAREATRLLPSADVKAVPGGVEMEGPLTVGLHANLALRLPTRLLLRLGEARAREFGQLRHQVARLPWEQFLPANAPIRISASATHCRLYHTGGIDENVRAAIGDRMGAPPDKAATNSDAPLVLVRGVDDRWTISIDSSGERLHRRGWRTDGHEAPLRETLAASLLELCDWRPGQALVDPMCGAGTLPIEAATAALGLAPGLERPFAFESWPGFEAGARATWDALKSTVRSQSKTELDAPIAASDEDAKAVAATQGNAARAGVAQVLHLRQCMVLEVEPEAPSGLFIANPPYGRRIGSRSTLPALYRQIGVVLRKRFRGWQAGVVLPDARLASAFQLPIVASHRMFHGGLSVTLIRLAP
jgi:putative N6-adenine-specific DNA methylase